MQEITNDAKKAKHIIASAAEEALKVISNATSEALKIRNETQSNDHDLLIKIGTVQDMMLLELKEIKDGTSLRISDHETRLGKLEKTKNTQTVLISIGISLLTILSGMLLYHLFQMGV